MLAAVWELSVVKAAVGAAVGAAAGEIVARMGLSLPH